MVVMLCSSWCRLVLDYPETRQRTHSPRKLTTPVHPFRRSSAQALLRTSVLRTMCALYTRTHVWLQETPHDRCRGPASAGLPGPSCFGFAPTVPAPLQGSFASPTAGALCVPNARQRTPPSTSSFTAPATLNNAAALRRLRSSGTSTREPRPPPVSPVPPLEAHAGLQGATRVLR
ncbi:hypothetical protein HPB51_028253 [Rhipicephalus microplus]|uniref:Uncharacterized protein n=1 Tax=Rhipicephalus microplus TaxID=6941 RepID=A0A9J6CXU4_RHIMP|nr:hypothetical protein HPB51_028253 [Rhipicephalus microplus]